MNENWPRWLISSSCKHFKDRVNYPAFWTIYQVKPNKPPNDRYELCVQGPNITFGTDNDHDVKMVFNLGVFTQTSDGDLTVHADMVGKGLASFTKCIRVLKLGRYPNIDTGEFFCTLQLVSEVVTDTFGFIDQSQNIILSSIEATYRATNIGDT